MKFFVQKMLLENFCCYAELVDVICNKNSYFMKFTYLSISLARRDVKNYKNLVISRMKTRNYIQTLLIHVGISKHVIGSNKSWYLLYQMISLHKNKPTLYRIMYDVIIRSKYLLKWQPIQFFLSFSFNSTLVTVP